MLSVISDQPRSVPAIARRLGQARQSVQRVVHQLEAARLVVLEPNPDHVRSPLVVLSDEGRTILDGLFKRSAQSRANLLDRAGVSAEQLDDARQTIRKLVAAYDV